MLLLIYYIIGGILVFFLHRPATDEEPASVDSFLAEKEGVDRALIIEDRVFSAVTRINLIEEAQHSVQLAYYAVHDGLAGDVFYASVLEAADRGVKIELLFDGIFHNLKGKEKATHWALIRHPNVSVRFFEPLHILKPWTFNNRLHDKFIIVDDTYVILGGRNIGDKYYLEDYPKEIVKDRDVLIINTEAPASEQSVVADFSAYFQELWEHRYTSEHPRPLSERKERKAADRHQELLDRLEEIRTIYPDRFEKDIDWLAHSLPTNKVTLVVNPLTRLNKDPMVLKTLINLTAHAKERILVQSPYIIPSRSVSRYRKARSPESELILLTNSAAASPNYFAVGGYLKHRRALAKESEALYEYHGPGSIHAKSYLFDSRLSAIGSFNVDGRSAFLSTESMVIIDSEAMAASLSEVIEELIADSVLYGDPSAQEQKRKLPWYKVALITISRILLYPFDEFL